jgi:hypothetical protein
MRFLVCGSRPFAGARSSENSGDVKSQECVTLRGVEVC